MTYPHEAIYLALSDSSLGRSPDSRKYLTGHCSTNGLWAWKTHRSQAGGPFLERDIGQPGTPKWFSSLHQVLLNHSKVRETEAISGSSVFTVLITNQNGVSEPSGNQCLSTELSHQPPDSSRDLQNFFTILKAGSSSANCTLTP